MNNILIIEDSLDRIRQFKKNFTNANITFVDNVNDSIETIKTEKAFDYIFFDHDLGENGGDSIDVAKWLDSNQKDNMPKHIYIHSANPVGSLNIKRYLQKSILSPMVWKNKIDFCDSK